MLTFSVINFVGIAEQGFQETTDAYDWLIASFIYANMQGSRHPKLIVDEKMYLCFSYQDLISEIPFMAKQSQEYYRKKTNHMVEVGIIEKVNKGGVPNAYRLTERANNAMQCSRPPNETTPPPNEMRGDSPTNGGGYKYIYKDINIYKEKENTKEKENQSKAEITPSLVGKEIELTPPIIAPTPPLDFEVFWKAYPNKKGKAGAKAKWDTLKKSKQLPATQILLDAIKKQTLWRTQAKQGEFRPEWKHPSTWLHQGCWEDEVEVMEENDGRIQIDGGYFLRNQVFFWEGKYHAIAAEPSLYHQLKKEGKI